MIKLPYGRADFGPMMRDKCFYVDRTNYIEQLEVHAPVYTMFLRPRRFGKSLWISVLEHYYDVHKIAEFQSLFGDLYIGQHKTPSANQFLILRFDFSGIETNDVRKVNESFLMKVKEGFIRFVQKYPSHFDPEIATKLEQQPLASSMAVQFFLAYSKQSNQPPIYLLIDEYDQFTNELLSFHFADFKDIVSKNGYVRKFYEVLKAQAMLGVIARIFMTGVAPVTVDSMTSGFNIVTDLSMHPFFHDLLGFTEAEVMDLLQKIKVSEEQIPQILTDLRSWYDGYRFHRNAPRHLYNPEMVLYFMQYFQSVREYPEKMLSTNVATDYHKISAIFRIAKDESLILTQISQFLQAGTIQSYLTQQFNVALGFTISDIWSMLFYSGMTTIHSVLGNNYTFQLPNYVIKRLYYDYFMALQLGMSYGNLRHEIRESVEQLVMYGNIELFTNYVARVLDKEHSTRDNYGYNEKHLKTLVIGMLFPYESYLIRSEIEHERRFIDIFLERIPQVDIKYEILLELKYVKKDNQSKWADKDGKPVDAPAPATPVKKVAQSRKPKTPAPPVPATPAPIPVKPFLEDVAERGYQQLCEYMALPRFQRPNLLGFCLVFVDKKCYKVLPYQPN